MKLKVKEMISDLKAIFTLFGFSAVASVLNYLFQILMGNMLSVSDFGVFNATFSLANNVAVAFSPFAIALCKITAESNEDISENKRVYLQYAKIISLVCVIILLGGMLIYPVVKGKFGADTFGIWTFILSVAIIQGLFTIFNGIFQGIQQYIKYGIISVLLIIIKLIFGFLFAEKNMGAIGGILAVMFSTVICLLIIASILCPLFKKQPRESRALLTRNQIINSYVATLVAQLMASFYINGGELVLLELVYDERTVGFYSSVVLFAKISSYIMSIMSVVILPKISKMIKEKKSTKDAFKMIIVLCIMGGVAYAFLLMGFGPTVITRFLGSKYLEGTALLPYMAFMSIPLTTISPILNYYLGLGKAHKFITIISASVIITMTIIIKLKPEIFLVPIIISVGLWVVVLFSLIDVTKKKKNENMEG